MSQKHELLISPGSGSDLFDQGLLEKVSGQVKEDSHFVLFVPGQACPLAVIWQGQVFVFFGSYELLASGYSSPLDYPCSGSTSSGKRSAFPNRGGGGKRSWGGRGVSPPKSKRGFWKWESYPCLHLTSGCLSLHWQDWRNRGTDPWVVEVLQEGYRIPFMSVSPLSSELIPMPSYSTMSTEGKALEEVTLSLVQKGAVELAPLPSPGYYSRLFVVWKTSGLWRPVIDLSLLNRSISKTPFKMETLASVLVSVRQGDWMVSLDLEEAYLQVLVYLDSRKFLRFVAFSRAYQFRALCFGLSTAPQDFTRVMAPVSSILHGLGIRLRRYLDDWLVQASSREAVLSSLETVLSLCLELGIVVNLSKSNFVLSQRVHYLGTVIDSVSFRASPSQKRVEKLLSTGEEFLSSRLQPASS